MPGDGLGTGDDNPKKCRFLGDLFPFSIPYDGIVAIINFAIGRETDYEMQMEWGHSSRN